MQENKWFGHLSALGRWLLLAALLCLPATAGAVTTGKIAGQVLDRATREPLVASVRIVGATLGGLADNKGEYFILNVPPGVYSLQVDLIGYIPVTVRNVVVHVDLTTFQNIEMEATVLEVTEPLVVLAKRSLVDKSLTGTHAPG